MTDTTAPLDPARLDPAKLEAFGAKMVGILNGGMAAIMISVGHQVGLFDAMSGLPPVTSAELATRAGLHERYVREWLGAMATAGIVEYHPGRGAFTLPPEHAAMTTRAAGRDNVAAVAQFVPVCGGVESEVIDKFRNGGGVPYTSYPRFHEVMAEVSGAAFDSSLVDVALPMVPGLIDQLRAGIDVADVGTGRGHAVNVMARAFPASHVTGFDLSDDTLSFGRIEAEAWGLTNTAFEVKDAAQLGLHERFDFITTFDAVHDQARPDDMVQSVFAALKPGGYWLCVDIQASTHVGENLDHPMGTFGYTISCTHCMTVSLAYDGDGLGAMWGVQAARAMFGRAGFTDIRVETVPGDTMNNYYVCRKP